MLAFPTGNAKTSAQSAGDLYPDLVKTSWLAQLHRPRSGRPLVTFTQLNHLLPALPMRASKLGKVHTSGRQDRILPGVPAFLPLVFVEKQGGCAGKL